eukprot:1160631-Pelagomonas_calceolata.AAC.1
MRGSRNHPTLRDRPQSWNRPGPPTMTPVSVKEGCVLETELCSVAVSTKERCVLETELCSVAVSVKERCVLETEQCSVAVS